MDLGFLAPAYAAAGPFATAYLDTTSAVEGAAVRIAARWRARREELAVQGADEDTLDAMGEAAGRDHGMGAGQVLVGSQGRLLLDVRLPAPPRRQSATWGPLPDVLPMVTVLADAVPYLLVVADRAGADITAYGDHGAAAGERHVHGDTFDIRKVKPGDWAHKKYQQRAENLWQTNAKSVAEQVAGVASSVRARIIVAAGDVRALAYLRDSLPPPAREILREVDEGGRAAGASTASLDEHVRRLVAETAVRDTMAVLDEFEQERGQHDRAVEGLGHTLAALRRAQVQTVVAGADLPGDLFVFIGPEPMQIAVEHDELADLGVEVVTAPVGPAILRAAVATGADLVIVPGGPTRLAGGVGALLRYADAGTPA
jgi:hypothetical protein